MEKREKARQYWFVVQQLTARELKRKYARSVLGVVWSVLNPLPVSYTHLTLPTKA